jgi:hypothetical protein
MQPDVMRALEFYECACKFVTDSGLRHEIEWQRNLRFPDFDETDLLREAAWVVLCSGFREATVRRLFDYISLCFCDWESAAAIIESSSVCVRAASASFRNPAKLRAIVSIADSVNTQGFSGFKADVLASPIAALQRFPFVGPVTALHLAKNLGLEVVKPDRHLVRASERFGFADPLQLCRTISTACNEPLSVVDLVIWRFLASSVQVPLTY